MKAPSFPMANVQPNGYRLGWKGGLYDPSQAQTPTFRPGQAQGQQSPYANSTPYGQQPAPQSVAATPPSPYRQPAGQGFNAPPAHVMLKDWGAGRRWQEWFDGQQNAPEPSPEEQWQSYVAQVAAQNRGPVTDYRYIARPPMARPGSAPAPYTNQEEYRRYMNQAMPGWHTDRQLKKMVPWEFNPANPDRGERPSELSAFMQQMR